MKFTVLLGLCLAACAHPAPEASDSDAGPAARAPEPTVDPGAGAGLGAGAGAGLGMGALDAADLPSAEAAESVFVPRREPGLCDLLCARSAYLHCPAADSCVARCNQMRTMVSCAEPIKAMFQCYLKVPSGTWKCNARGIAALPPDVCPQEQARALDCLSP
ncbi:MAG TPA: hypothetical protein VHV30_06985 [Polyangiaceae bacterium]|jgi:hypothetical protein|nr:hypothetical protein [Polyangiaceae bacterium]